MKKIKDYLHLYLNANVKCRCFSLADREGWISNLDIDLIIDFFDADSEICAVMPILRKLEDMGEEEKHDLVERVFGKGSADKFSETKFKFISQGICAFTPETTIHLLREGFDLFGLIDAGLAVNAKDLKV